MADTFNKKALQQKKAKKKQDKRDKKEDRKMNNDKGKTLEDMIMYLDENGNFTTVHPDKQKKAPVKKIDNDEVVDAYATYTGTVSLFFAEKNYGFIKEDNSRDTIFVHGNALKQSIKEHDKVSFNKERTNKGYSAINVEKI